MDRGTDHGALALTQRLALPAGVAGAVAASVAAVVVRDPHVPGSWGVCPVLALTGYACPGCGGLRAANDLAHLRVLDALSSNAWVVVFFGLLGVVWLAWTRARAVGRPMRWDRWVTPGAAWVVLGSLVAFTVLRNTPLLAVLAP